MYKLLIVDDEPFYRVSIKRIIDWSALGLSDPEEAINGVDALEKMKTGRFDLVITDIKMPKMDGLELIARAREIDPRCCCIVLSAYDEFSLVKQAFRLGAVDYLLKHQISQENVSLAVRHFRERRNQIGDSVFRERIFKASFLMNIASSPLAPKEISDVLSIPDDRHGGRIYPARGRIHIPESHEGDRNWEGLISTIERSMILSHSSVFWHREKGWLTLFLISGKVWTWHELENFWNSVQGLWSDMLAPGTLSIGFADPSNFFHELPASLNEAEDCLHWYVSRGKGAVISPPRIRERDEAPAFPAVEKLAQDLIDSHPEQSIQILNALTLSQVGYRNCPPESLRLYFSRVLAHLLTSVELMQLKDQSQIQTLISAMRGGADEWDLNDFHHFLNNMIKFFASIKTVDNRLVGEAVRYLCDHYREPVTLSLVAEKLGVNSSYLSRLFTRERGTGFARYLAEVRVKAAVKLMEQDYLRVSELAELVGIGHPETFCRVFKRVMGMSPSSYVQSRGKKLAD